MASSASFAKATSSASLTNLAVAVRVFGVAGAASVAYAAYASRGLLSHGELQAWLLRFLTGPGRTSRILLLLFVAFNLKSMPFVWTMRIFGAMLRHTLWPRKPLPPTALYHYSITQTRTSLMETDYNLHKSNSTYFSDLDTSRTHLVMHLLAPAIAAAGRNGESKLVCSPETGEAMPGNFGVGLGAVFCSFRKEIAPYQPYEMWTRVLSWDRKWLYLVTHFVVKGKVKPASWDSNFSVFAAKTPTAGTRPWTAEDEANLQKYVIATAVSKYVFKIGRYTVHPTYLIEASGLLPERPGEGWRGGGPDAVGDVAEDVDAVDGDDSDDSWTWKNVERERRRGMVYASQLAGLDDVGATFDGGKNGALGIFGPG